MSRPQRESTGRRRRPEIAVPLEDCDGVSVEITGRQRILSVDSGWLARIVRAALSAAGIRRAEIGVRLVDDAGIARLHERWLGVPGPTDVITFDLANEAARDGLHGDIVASTETARRLARELGWQPRHELAYYVIHGLLHLTGEDDHTPADRRRMRSRERALMAAAGLPPPPDRRRRRLPAKGGDR
jgi:probable rRNA maturation factor